MRVYIAHNMDGSEDLHIMLGMVKSETAVAWKLVEERVSLLRKTEEENETTKAKTHRLAKEKKAMEAGKNKVEEEAGWMR